MCYFDITADLGSNFKNLFVVANVGGCCILLFDVRCYVCSQLSC